MGGVLYYLIANLSTLGFLCRSLPGVFEHNTTTSEVNGSLWTIKIELAFYLVLPVFCAIRNKISSAKNKNIFLATLYVLSLLWRYAFLYVAKITHSGLWGQIALQFPGYVNFFVTGMLLYYNFNFFEKHYKKMIFPALFLSVLYFTHGFFMFFALALGILIFAFSFHIPHLTKFFQSDDYSYGIYLFHQPVIHLAVYYGFFAANATLSIFLIVGFAFFCGFLSWHLVEKHIIRN